MIIIKRNTKRKIVRIGMIRWTKINSNRKGKILKSRRLTLQIF